MKKIHIFNDTSLDHPSPICLLFLNEISKKKNSYFSYNDFFPKYFICIYYLFNFFNFMVFYTFTYFQVIFSFLFHIAFYTINKSTFDFKIIMAYPV